MIHTSLFSPIFSSTTRLPSTTSLHCTNNKTTSINLSYLKSQFTRTGVTFENLTENIVITKLALENGSTATVMLPSGLITSYKVPVWHGGKVELLQTLVSQGEDGGAAIEGGVSLEFEFGSESDNCWRLSNDWVLNDIRGDQEEDSIKVELISNNAEEMVETKHIMTLTEDTLTSEFIVSNSKTVPIRITGSFLSHFAVSTPDATYAYGLENSNFVNRHEFSSKFGIVPPEEDTGSGFGQVWNQMSGANQSSKVVSRKVVEKVIVNEEGEENENYKQLTEEMSRIYTFAPQNFTMIDRGRRNSVVLGREGFEELYIVSPGSGHEWYSKYAYVCIGPSALLKPITIKPGHLWRGVQHLHNPNL